MKNEEDDSEFGMVKASIIVVVIIAIAMAVVFTGLMLSEMIVY